MASKEQRIKQASWIAIAGNAAIAIAKITVGLVAGSLAVVADGIDSLTDIVTSLITLVTARIMEKPPDIRFPYGYAKADTIATKALSFIIFFAGIQLAAGAIKQLANPAKMVVPGYIAIAVTLLSIGVKIALAWHQKKVGRETGSSMLAANGRNMQNDVLISISVLTGLLFTILFKLPVIDTLAALLVSIWILKEAWQIFRQTNYDLMDGIKDCSIYNEIFKAIDAVDGVHNPHRVRARKIGDKLMIAIDIEVDGNLTVSEAHEISHNVEKHIKNTIPNIFDVAIHVEPTGDDIEEKPLGLSKTDLTSHPNTAPESDGVRKKF